MQRSRAAIHPETFSLESDAPETHTNPKQSRVSRRGGRVVYRVGLENRSWATNRGFESHPLRHYFDPP